MLSRFVRIVGIVSTILLFFNLPFRSQSSAQGSAGEANLIYLPLVVQASVLPQSWQLYVNLQDQFRLVVPDNWKVEELPGQTLPVRAYISLDNIPTDWPDMPPDIGGPNYPGGIFKIELTTREQTLDPLLTFEDNARALIEDGLVLVTGFSIDPAYPNGTFIELGRQGAPDYHAKIFATAYASEGGQRLLIVAAYPNDSWNNCWAEPLIQFIVNSLDFE